MKLLFDQNLSYRLVAKVSEHGFPPHIIWLRMGNSSVDKSTAVLLGYAERIKAMILGNQTGIVEVIG